MRGKGWARCILYTHSMAVMLQRHCHCPNHLLRLEGGLLWRGEFRAEGQRWRRVQARAEVLERPRVALYTPDESWAEVSECGTI